MRKLIILLVVIGLMVITGLITYAVTSEIIRAKIIQNIEVDGVNEVDKGIITLKINGQYYDYEYNPSFKTLQKRINNGEIENITIDEIKSNGKNIDNALVTMNILGHRFDYYMEK